MERRREPRVDAGQPVSLVLLDREGPPLAARVRDASAAGLALVLQSPLTPGQLVCIEHGDHLLLGEVVHARPEEFDFVAGIHIRHAVHHLNSLASMARRLSVPYETPVAWS